MKVDERSRLLDIAFILKIVSNLGYVGAFVAGVLGSSSLFISIFPSYVVITLLGATLNPIIVGVLGGLGAGVGQFLHYYVGLGGRYLLSTKRREGLDKWRKRLDKYGVILIFLFAATPLTPDDLIWIPLGAMRYPKLKALLAAISGKIILNLIYAHVGHIGWEYLYNLVLA
ncbi:MAG: VTT domain-containing protein [Halobacteria archaeon]